MHDDSQSNQKQENYADDLFFKRLNKNPNVLVPENCIERLRNSCRNTSVQRKLNSLFEM